MSNGEKYFVDIHCHLFNVEHVPLRQSIKRITYNFNRKLIVAGVSAAGAYALPPVIYPALVLGANTIARKIYKKLQAFIRFFDQPAEKNIESIVKSLEAIGADGEMSSRTKVFTPLIMDFEPCESYKSLKAQIDDLKKAIANNEILLESNSVKILPFLGVDPRRFYGCQPGGVSTAFKAFLDGVGVGFAGKDERTDVAALNNGEFIGVKWYPSLGFEVSPRNPEKRRVTVELLKEFIKMDLPVTVHCQKDSYECDENEMDSTKLIGLANPAHWSEMFKQYPSLRNMRINFAHFGGEDGVADSIMWGDEFPSGADNMFHNHGVFSSTWTHEIIKLIKTYPNCYADISAFDFNNKKAVASLAWLLAMDEKGKLDHLGENHKLLDKLMWGSDLPMTLAGYSDYKELFAAFLKAIDFSSFDAGDYTMPGGGKTPSHLEVYEKLVHANPLAFLCKRVMG